MYKQKIKELLIGTNNKGKLREIKSLLPNYFKIYSTSNFKLKSPVENGKTFEENSIIKSKYFSKKTNLLCLADDSGLEIDLLNKKPGIFSARWAGTKGDFKKAIKKVYKELVKISGDRTLEIQITKTGDKIKVSTRRGTVKIRVREDRAIPEGVIFIPFCYNEAAANLLTNPALDPYGKIPEFKYCAAKIEKL